MTGFSLYDRASGAPKSMAFVYRASHNGFITTNSDAFDVTISETAQNAVTLAYTNAFFRQHLRGETQWQGMFEGAWKPASVTSAGVELYVQHRKPGSQTVDDFQTVPTWQGSSSGGVVDHGGSLPIDPREGRLVNVGPTPGLDPHSPHDSKGLEIKWDGLGDRLVWTIPRDRATCQRFPSSACASRSAKQAPSTRPASHRISG
jgi:hypothetical protein